MQSQVTPFELALVCNDIENVELYTVVGDECHYCGTPVGKVSVDWNYHKNGTVTRNILLQPRRPVEYIEVRIEV